MDGLQHIKKQTDQPLKTEEGFDLKIRSRNSKPVTIQIPADTLASLEKIAAGRDMSVEALLKAYIGRIWQSYPPTAYWRKPRKY